MHPVEPRAAGLLLPTVRPKGRRLSVVLPLAINSPEKPLEVGPPAEAVSEQKSIGSQTLSRDCLVSAGQHLGSIWRDTWEITN